MAPALPFGGGARASLQGADQSPSTRPAPGNGQPPSTQPVRPSPGNPSPGRPSPGNPSKPNNPGTRPPRPSPGNPGGGPPPRPNPGKPTPGKPNPGRPNPGKPTPGKPTPGRPTPGRPNPGRPGTGRPPNGRPRPPYNFRPGDSDRLRRHYRRRFSYINRSRRPVFVIGGYIPFGDRGYFSPIPSDLLGYLPPVPPGYVVGYFDGYCVVYDPVTFAILNFVDLLN